MLSLGLGCGSSRVDGDSETHWLDCETTADCDPGYECRSRKCQPIESDASSGGAGSDAAPPDARAADASSNLDARTCLGEQRAPASCFGTTEPEAAFVLATSNLTGTTNLRIFSSLVVADDSFVYYAESGCTQDFRGFCAPTEGVVARIPRCGGAPEILHTGSDFLLELLDGGSVLYAIPVAVSGPGPQVIRIDKASGAVESLGLSARAATVTPTALVYYDGERVQWIAHDSVVPHASVPVVAPVEWLVAVGQAVLAGHNTTPLWRVFPGAAEPVAVEGLAPGSYVIALIEAGDRALARVDSLANGATELFSVSENGPLTLLAPVQLSSLPPRNGDGIPVAWTNGVLYLTRNSGQGAGPDVLSTWRATPEAPNEASLVLCNAAPSAVDDGTVFWFAEGELRAMRVTRP